MKVFSLRGEHAALMSGTTADLSLVWEPEGVHGGGIVTTVGGFKGNQEDKPTQSLVMFPAKY